MIEINSISLTLENGRKILDDVSLSIRKNEHWVLIGRNGSGKSKLLEIICGYTRQSSGSVVRFGDPSPDLREIRKRIGYVASYLKTHIANYNTVISIVTGGYYGSIGLYDEPDVRILERARELLSISGLEGFEERLFVTLSDGEKQRVLSARAFMVEPEIVVFDEPSAGLDILSRENLLESLQTILSVTGASLIYVTHHVEEITPVFTHFALMEHGRIVKSGQMDMKVLKSGIEFLFGGQVSIEYDGNRLYSRMIK